MLPLFTSRRLLEFLNCCVPFPDREVGGVDMAPLVSKRKTRSQGPPTPIEKVKPLVEEEGPIPEVIVAGDDSDSDPEISTDGEESGEDGDEDGASVGEEDDDEEGASGSEDEEKGDSEGLVSVFGIFFLLSLLVEFWRSINLVV